MPRTSAEPRPLTAVADIAAAPPAVWAVVSDVRRTAQWSPECVSVRHRGRLRVGRLLLGLNRRAWVGWATVSRVHVLEPGRTVGWTVLTNRSQWSYHVEPYDGGTRLTETRRTPRGEGAFAVWFTTRFLGGQAPHDDELEAGMRSGLERIAALVGADGHPPSP